MTSLLWSLKRPAGSLVVEQLNPGDGARWPDMRQAPRTASWCTTHQALQLRALLDSAAQVGNIVLAGGVEVVVQPVVVRDLHSRTSTMTKRA